MTETKLPENPDPGLRKDYDHYSFVHRISHYFSTTFLLIMTKETMTHTL